MGIISFLKDIAVPDFIEKKLEERGLKKEQQSNETRSEEIKNLILSYKFPIQNLGVAVAGTRITLSGNVATPAEKQKLILAIGNIPGITEVEDNITTPTPAADSTEDVHEGEMYTIKSGDTLSALALHYYGDANAYMQIYYANTPMLENPNWIYPGQVLRIPKKGTIVKPTAAEGKYIVVEGDSLWAIAEKVYGNGSKFTQLIEKNPETIPNQNAMIHPGLTINI